MTNKPLNTIDVTNVTSAIRQWMEWRDALKGVDPVKLMPALLAMRASRINRDVLTEVDAVIALLPQPKMTPC